MAKIVERESAQDLPAISQTRILSRLPCNAVNHEIAERPGKDVISDLLSPLQYFPRWSRHDHIADRFCFRRNDSNRSRLEINLRPGEIEDLSGPRPGQVNQ